jgi:pseudouridine kinase
VNIRNLLVSRNDPTAAWVGILDEYGNLDVGIFGGQVLDAITPPLICEWAAAIADADLIAVDATLPRAAMNAIVALAKANHLSLCLNPASAARARTVADIVGDYAIVSANALEAEMLTGESVSSIDDAKRAAHVLVARGVRRALVTLGAQGMVYADALETRYASALPAHVVDTTGAGDALLAMFLVCHLNACSLDETLARALHAAALTVACDESASDEISRA